MSEDDLKILADITRPVLRPIPRDPDRVIDAPIPDDYRFKTSEEAELLPLPLQILRLKEINAELCHTHNTLVISNARLEAEKQDAYDKGWNAARGEALKACEDELLTDNTGTLDDAAYNLAVRDCIGAISRALPKPTAARQGEPS